MDPTPPTGYLAEQATVTINNLKDWFNNLIDRNGNGGTNPVNHYALLPESDSSDLEIAFRQLHEASTANSQSINDYTATYGNYRIPDHPSDLMAVELRRQLDDLD